MNIVKKSIVTRLFESVKIGIHTSKNRFVVAPMSRVSATQDGLVSEAMHGYYLKFAEGGFGAIITEGIYTDGIVSQAYPNQPGLTTIKQMESWRNLIHEIKGHGSLIIAQLMHAGALSQVHNSAIAPSAIKPLGKRMSAYGGYTGEFPAPTEASVLQIKEVVTGFTQAASLAYEAGFDGIEIHAANGYLLDQFLTDHLNKRNDSYGGNCENNFRIVREIFGSIRKSVPANFVVGIRLSEGKVNQLDYRWENGPEKAMQVLKQVREVKPGYVHIAAEKGDWEEDCRYKDGSSFNSLAKMIVNVPVVANGGLQDLNKAKTIIEECHADLLSIGKAAISDPALPLKVKMGMSPIPFNPELIRKSAAIKN